MKMVRIHAASDAQECLAVLRPCVWTWAEVRDRDEHGSRVWALRCRRAAEADPEATVRERDEALPVQREGTGEKLAALVPPELPSTSSMQAIGRRCSASSAPSRCLRTAPSSPAKKPAAAKTKTSNSPSTGKGLPRKARKPASLPKSDGDAGVQAYIASMEPWQAAIAKRVDALVVKHVPGVHKAVRWHSPFYGVEGQGWFLAFSAFQYHVKFSFFKGTSLKPVPPIGQFKDVRSLDIRQSDRLDEKQLAAWIEQAASTSGWDGGSARGGGSPL